VLDIVRQFRLLLHSSTLHGKFSAFRKKIVNIYFVLMALNDFNVKERMLHSIASGQAFRRNWRIINLA
jgi:hypothetical protein